MTKKMKDSGIEWIGNTPEDWEVKKTKQIFKRKKELAKQENPIVLSLTRDGIKVRDIANNEGQLAESYFNYNIVEPGDLLLNPMDLYSGANCNVSQVHGVISPAYINLQAYHNNNARYFDYFFKTQYWAMVLFAHGKGVSFDHRWTLSNETLMKYNLPVPPIKEQQTIANYLDQKVSEIDRISQLTKDSIEEYKKYKQSLITETVTKGLNPDAKMKDSGIEWIGEIPEHWEVVRLKNIASSYGGLTYSPNDVCDESEGVLVLRSSNIQNGKLAFHDNVYVRNEVNKKLITKRGDILVCSRNGSRHLIGKNALIDKNYGYTFGAFMTVVRSKYYRFIHYFLNSNIFEAQSSLFLTSTVNQLTLGVFNNMNLVIPKEDEQQAIADFLEQKCAEIDQLIAQKERLLIELEAYKKSLIYECVTGKREVV